MGSNFYLLNNGKKIFGGRTQFRRIQEGTSISITGIDFTGMIGLRQCTYEVRIDIESSQIVKTLLQQFIRKETESIPNFNINYDKYIIESATEKKWNFTRTSVLDSIVNIARTTSARSGTIGYFFFIDPELYVHFEPINAYTIKDILPFSNLVFDEDQRDIKNQVEYFGGRESTYPVIPDSWTDYGNAQDWIARYCRECQTICQTGCESPNPCQTCGQADNCETSCELACQASGCGQVCQNVCESVCQYDCQTSCQICAEEPPGGLVGI